MVSIVVVDDDKHLLTLIGTVLASPLYKLNLFATGRSAIEFAERSAVDLVICDWHLPDLAATEVISRIQSQHSHAAILVISGAQLDDITLLREKNAPSLLMKPFSNNDLRNAVVALLRRDAARTQQSASL